MSLRLAPTPEECRRFFVARGDTSLGLLPQAWLSRPDADRWSLFWFACRQVDDTIETREVSGAQWLRRLRSREGGDPATAAFEAFLASVPDSWRDGLRSEADQAVRALASERERSGPPDVPHYVETLRWKAGFPLAVLNRLLMPQEPVARVRAFALPLAASIQLGDDARDLGRDRSLGIDNRLPGEPEDLVACRERTCRFLVGMALRRARALARPAAAQAHRQAVLWAAALEAGALRDRSPGLEKHLARPSPQALDVDRLPQDPSSPHRDLVDLVAACE